MFSNVLRTVCAVAVTLLLASPLYAQNPNANPNAQKPKKSANQVPETGPNDPNEVPDTRFDRAIENLVYTELPDGTVYAKLDDTFMEATTVSIGADGKLTFEHFTGIANAEAAVRRRAGIDQPAGGLLPARAWSFQILYPINMDKE